MDELTQKDLFEYLKKKHRKKDEKLLIECYIECHDCGEQLSEAFALKRSHMEFSLLRFLQHLFLATPTSDFTDPQAASQKEDEPKKCSHKRKVRAFRYDETMVKF